MTAINSAAKVVGQLRKWFAGNDVEHDHLAVDPGDNAARSVFNCNYSSSDWQYRGRSYSDCYSAAAARYGQQPCDLRERSRSVSSRRGVPSRWRGLAAKNGHLASCSARRINSVSETLDEDKELYRFMSETSVEPVCCCERCFLYVNHRSHVLPPPPYDASRHHRAVYNCNDEPFRSSSISAASAADESYHVDCDDVELLTEVCTKSSDTAECISVPDESEATVSAGTDLSTAKPETDSINGSCPRIVPDDLPTSVHASMDGEEGFLESQRQLRWARRQRQVETGSSVNAPPNRTICHVVDCW